MVAVAATISVVTVAATISVVAIAPTISTAIIAPVTVPVASAVVAVMTPAPAVPWACADEYPARKPLRAVVAVWSASVGIIRVVAPFADWWPVVVVGVIVVCVRICYDRRSDAHTKRDLCFCHFGQRQRQERCKQEQLELSHDTLLVLPIRLFRIRETGRYPFSAPYRPLVALPNWPYNSQTRFRGLVAVFANNL
jgi:hypothetical protein